MKYFRAPRSQHRAPEEVSPTTALARQSALVIGNDRDTLKDLDWGCSNTFITFSAYKFSSGKNKSSLSYTLLECLPFKCLWGVIFEGRKQKQSIKRDGSTFVRDQLPSPISYLNFKVTSTLPEIWLIPLIANLRKYKKLKIIPKYISDWKYCWRSTNQE